jgi:hypothetical protein
MAKGISFRQIAIVLSLPRLAALMPSLTSTKKQMKSGILGIAIIIGVWAAAQGQPTPVPGPSVALAPPPQTGTNFAGRGTFASRLQNIVNNFPRVSLMENRPGVLITRRATKLGSITAEGQIDVVAVACSDTRTNQTAYGVKVSVVEGLGSRPGDLPFVYVDYEEIVPLLKGLDSMSQIETSAEPFKAFEAAYITNGGLRVTMHWGGAVNFSISVQSGRDRLASINLTQAQLATFRDLFQSALAMLDSAKKAKAP